MHIDEALKIVENFVLEDEHIEHIVMHAINGYINYWCDKYMLILNRQDYDIDDCGYGMLTRDGAEIILHYSINEYAIERDLLASSAWVTLNKKNFINGYRRYMKWCVRNDKKISYGDKIYEEDRDKFYDAVIQFAALDWLCFEKK